MQEKYPVDIKTVTLALNYKLIQKKKMDRLIKLNQEARLKSYIDMNTNLRTKAKNDFEKDFFKPMSNSVFEKTMKNLNNLENIKLVTTEKE